MVPHGLLVMVLVVGVSGEPWTPSTQTSRLGDVEVAIRAATTDPVLLRGHYFSTDEHLQIRVAIRNRGKTRSLHYQGWALRENDPAADNRAYLGDELGRNYSHMNYGDSPPLAQIQEQALPPGGRLDDLLVFALPGKQTKELRLMLPGQALGVAGEFRFAISIDDIDSPRARAAATEIPPTPPPVLPTNSTPSKSLPEKTEEAETEADQRVDQRRSMSAMRSRWAWGRCY